MNRRAVGSVLGLAAVVMLGLFLLPVVPITVGAECKNLTVPGCAPGCNRLTPRRCTPISAMGPSKCRARTAANITAWCPGTRPSCAAFRCSGSFRATARV